ncbi:hypothetical protein EJ08DRAFT_738278 [Tothia fuscella]|uniref:Protein NO VEIN C-terminal domain-containing protein n=1 Tax=Tothia fuscella TaxID=1048955 RepID=A0A9P4TSZ4_9PEZI|nr:hypothetical protein EJ08DRAFT_738278 [Tothia fuscella]
MPLVTVEEGAVFIDQLREERGGLSVEDQEHLQQERPNIWRSFEAVRRQLGAATRTLAKNLYAKDTRFVYELIQNAEDNAYSVCATKSENPSLHFSVSENAIFIDSNEDGFSESNIRAICSIGESTKANVSGYVGEKGIGFKSVFKVASKVHVQSGPYSFAFHNRREGQDESGLGMVTPFNEAHGTLPTGIRTRISLQLLPHYDKERLFDDFRKLPDTFLLFLKKLKVLSIRLEPSEGAVEETIYSVKAEGNRAIITKTFNSIPSSLYFWVAKRTIPDMPIEELRRNVRAAEVVLAFPLSHDDEPIIEDQHVFAYLPVRQVGYKFLIQSDFVCQASREDVFDSPWNSRLLQEASNLFLNTVQEFLLHATLKYRWIRYIPTDPIADEFWGRLRHTLLTSLHSRSVFYTQSERLCLASQLRIVPPWAQDDTGAPLLPDLDNGDSAYVCTEYDRTGDHDILACLDTRALNDMDFIVRLEHDLRRRQPRMHIKPSLSYWQTKVANQLIRLVQYRSVSSQIKRLPLVPLISGAWVIPHNGSIFFPTSGGIDVPLDLSLSLVDQEALLNQSRKLLFSKLSVIECEPLAIFPLIQQRYQTRSPIDVAAHKPHVRFLYWHHDQLQSGSDSFHFVNTRPQWFVPGPSRGWTYYPRGAGDYAAAKLLASAVEDRLELNMNILRDDYFDDLQQLELRHDQTPSDWLHSFLSLKTTIQLCSRTDYGVSSMSQELKFIAEKKPQFLLGVLKADWEHFNNCNTWNNFFSKCNIPILHSDNERRLKDTYLPLPSLLSITNRYSVSQDFGYIRELAGMTNENAGAWHFLKQFGVTIDENLQFWLFVLQKVSTLESTIIASIDVANIYLELQTRCRSQNNIELLRQIFDQACLWIPSSSGWVTRKQCVWNAPIWFEYMPRLSTITPYQGLQYLFATVLQIPNATVSQYLEYLESLKAISIRRELTNHDRVLEIYRELGSQSHDDDTNSSIQISFREKQLIYHPVTQTWHPPADCVWAKDDIQLPGKFSLATVYAGYAPLFTNILEIPKPTLPMHIRALREKVDHAPTKQDILQMILNICAFKPSPDDLQELVNCHCFPITVFTGRLEWRTSTQWFAIPDRREFRRAFEGKINILEFSLEEVHSIRPFLFGLGLENKYLSSLVTEETQVEGGTNDLRLTLDLRKKSYAMCRYAAHLKSQRVCADPTSIFRLLSNLEVYLSDDISRVLKVSVGSEVVTAPQATALFHLTELNNTLRLYVPRNERYLHTCLTRMLPLALLKYLGVPDPRAELGSIITAPSLLDVDYLLEDAGIIGIDGVERPEDEAGDSGLSNSPDQILGGERPRAQETPVSLQQNSGTLSPPFGELVERDPAVTNTSNRYQTITTMQPYQGYSLEELRLADYVQGRRQGNANGQAGPFDTGTGLRGFRASGGATTGFGGGNTSTGGEIPGGSGTATASPFGQQQGSLTSPQTLAPLVMTPENSSGSESSESTSQYPSGSGSPRELSQEYSGSSESLDSVSQNHSGSGSLRELSQDYIRNNPPTFSLSINPLQEEISNQWERLLDFTIRVARGMRGLPRKGETQRLTAHFGLPDFGTAEALASPIPMGREFKTGAAGELFVFELLQNLQLPGFAEHNWQSTIRHRISAHESYAHLQQWSGTETADIVYEDTEGTLTGRLIEQGYFDRAVWGNSCPKYYIEVKTTTDVLHTPFFVSQNQYDRMQDMTITGDGPANEVYLVARVFNLGQTGVGLMLYLDPAKWQSTGELHFRTDKYVVTPIPRVRRLPVRGYPFFSSAD